LFGFQLQGIGRGFLRTGGSMSRDSHIFFTGDSFPHTAWSELLALYDASEEAIDGFDRRRRIVRRWCLPTADESQVYVDLREFEPGLRVCFPKGYRWRVRIHASTGTSSEWFLYAIPILAGVRFRDTIFLDYCFVTCDLDGILLRASRVVPTRCDVADLARFGYIDGDSMWPSVLTERKVRPPTERTQEIARQYCCEKTEFYPEIGSPHGRPLRAGEEWATGSFIIFLIALPVGLVMGIPYVWGVSIVGIVASGLRLVISGQSR
jgi:hypothetical protein